MSNIITKEFGKFFKDLAQNNNTDWFRAHKKEYETQVRIPFIALIESLLPTLEELYPQIQMQAAKSLFRINRDIRFSKDKTPYHVIMKAGLSPGGKKSEWPGFYLGIDAEQVHVGGGLYQVASAELFTLRMYIKDHPQQFMRIIQNPDFNQLIGGLKGDRIKRIPVEFKEVAEKVPSIANKQFYAMATIGMEEFLAAPNQVDVLIPFYKEINPLLQFLHRGLGLAQ